MFLSSIAIFLCRHQPMLSQCLTHREVCGGVFGDLCSVLSLGGPFSLSLPFLLCIALLCSAFLNAQTLFFIIVPADECLVILSSGGFETGWTNDLSSFVPSLKGTWDSDLERGAVCIDCPFSYLHLCCFRGGVFWSFFIWEVLLVKLENAWIRSSKNLMEFWVHLVKAV